MDFCSVDVFRIPMYAFSPHKAGLKYVVVTGVSRSVIDSIRERGEVKAVFVVLKVSPELSVSGQLHHDPDGGGAADADQLDNVLVVELLHGVGLLEELFRHAWVRLHLDKYI